MDLIEIDRIARALERPRFRERVYTEAEREYCDSRPNPAQHYAARFAGKEAVGKALGCGVDFAWREIEIVGRPKPSVKLSGRTLANSVVQPDAVVESLSEVPAYLERAL